MKRRASRLAIAALVLACAALIAPRSATGYEAHVLSYSDELDVSSLNPFFASSGNITALSELTMGEFTRFDAKGNPIPELVTVEPTRANGGVSADGRTITWHLRHGVKWSDGAPFDSADVTYTVAVAKNVQNNLFVHDVWDRLIGANAPDKYTVVFRLREPYATFIADYFSTQSGSAVLPKHILGPGTLINQAPYNALPVGIGPFRYKAFNRSDSVVMEANPYYWRGRPKLHEVIYRIITDDNTLMTQVQTGELDLWDLVSGTYAARVATLPGKGTASRLSSYMSGIYFNNSRPQLADPAVRRALRAGTDRLTAFDKVYLRNGTRSESVVPQITRDYVNLPLVAYDPSGAAQQLDAAGWKLGSDGVRRKDGRPLTIDLAIPSGYQPSATMAAILHDNWGKLGVAVTIHTWSTPQFFATSAQGGILQTGRFDAALFSSPLGPVYPNINGAYDCESFPPHGSNASRYCDPAVDKLNDEYLHSYDGRVHAQTAAAFQRLIDRDCPAIVMYERAFLAVYDKRLTGYHPQPFSYWGDPLELDI